jgi:hypothetical protein
MLIAVDIDGTLFDCRARAHLIPADPSRAENWTVYNSARHLDVPREAVIDMVQLLSWSYEVILVTSAGQAALGRIADQMDSVALSEATLDMRPMDDHRSALEYKTERYRELKPDLIIEDHPGIVAALRAEGFTVLQIDSMDPTL